MKIYIEFLDTIADMNTTATSRLVLDFNAIPAPEPNHAGLTNLDYQKSGHTGFQPSGDYALQSDIPTTAKAITTEATGIKITQENFNLAMILDGHKDDWYGVEVTNLAATALPRVGKLDLHRSLPIHKKMRRCLLNVDGTINYYTHPDNTALKADGTPSILDGRDGDVMVELPRMYVKFEPSGNGTGYYIKISEYPLEGFVCWDKNYCSAFEASLDRTIPATPKLRSVMNTSMEFRGGGNIPEWDNTYKSLLGMPIAKVSQIDFRTYARNKGVYGLNGAGWNMHTNRIRVKLWLLYIIEYASTNSQSPFNSTLDGNGFKQGGLGNGVTTLTGRQWDNFNGYNPFIRCGYTNRLGNKTGVVDFIMPPEYDLTVQVPSYRGVENIFGHLNEFNDGCKIVSNVINNEREYRLYTCEDPSKYNSTIDVDSYQLQGAVLKGTAYIKEMIMGEIFPSLLGGDSNTYFCDQYSNDNISSEVKCPCSGGNAYSSLGAGLCYVINSVPPDRGGLFIGSRLCFLPTQQPI